MNNELLATLLILDPPGVDHVEHRRARSKVGGHEIRQRTTGGNRHDLPRAALFNVYMRYPLARDTVCRSPIVAEQTPSLDDGREFIEVTEKVFRSHLRPTVPTMCLANRPDGQGRGRFDICLSSGPERCAKAGSALVTTERERCKHRD